MKVYVVGAGAVGTYLGQALAATGAEVAYAPRRLEDVVHVPADLAIVAVKAYDTTGAIETLRRALGASSDTSIMTPQNGVGNEERLAAAFGADRIISAALTVPVVRTTQGAVATSKRGGMGLAPVGSIAHNWLVAAFDATSIPVKVVADYRALKWSKLELNIIANAACAILNVLPARLVRLEHTFGLEIRAVREARAVMAALRLHTVDLPRYPIRALQGIVKLPIPVAKVVLAARIAGARGRKPPSLLLDLQAAKGRTEVDVLNGAVAAVARDLGVPAPVNSTYARVLADIAHMPQLWAKYRERPAALLAEVEAEEARMGLRP
ncbi:MAG: ketopantoate reductase family protein [Candidatus Eremiobacteraeota bacterium]|nr:ketopantoate reductase family protein [Candidatus Eremiobacteraeota bacterium]